MWNLSGRAADNDDQYPVNNNTCTTTVCYGLVGAKSTPVKSLAILPSHNHLHFVAGVLPRLRVLCGIHTSAGCLGGCQPIWLVLSRWEITRYQPQGSRHFKGTGWFIHQPLTGWWVATITCQWALGEGEHSFVNPHWKLTGQTGGSLRRQVEGRGGTSPHTSECK